MVKMRFDVKGMEETLKYWRQGKKPIHIEGKVESKLPYALAQHEGLHWKTGAPFHYGRMLEKDIERISAGLSPFTNKPVKWGKKRIEAAIKGRQAMLAQIRAGTPEGKVGRKYLTRVLMYHLKMYVESTKDILPHAIALLSKQRGATLMDAYAIVAEAFLIKVIQHITARAAENAPFWHGDLRASIMGYIKDRRVAKGPPLKSTEHWKRLMEKAPSVRHIEKGVLMLATELARA